MKNKEIELKFKISEDVYKKIIIDLDASATKTGESGFVDTYYIPDFREFEIDGVTHECVRIRQTEKGNVLCYKKIHYEANPVYCDEFGHQLPGHKEFSHGHCTDTHLHSLSFHHDRPAPHGQTSDRRAGTQRTGSDHDAIRPCCRSHAGLRHSASGRHSSDSGAAVPFHAAKHICPAQRALSTAGMRHADHHHPSRPHLPGRHAPQPPHH